MTARVSQYPQAVLVRTAIDGTVVRACSACGGEFRDASPRRYTPRVCPSCHDTLTRERERAAWRASKRRAAGGG